MSELCSIIGISKENYDTVTIEFRMDEKASPGQFVMVWTNGMEEIPMSLSKTERIKSVTVKNIGPDTARLHELSIGDMLNIRGPYGHGFKLKKDRKYLIVAGGVGAAALIPAVKATGGDTIIGARTDKDIILEDRAEKYSKNVWFSTDDGSRGFHGNAVQLMTEKLQKKKYDCVLACGPEIMLYYLHKACIEAKIPCQISLERRMKCGAGVCGCCVMDGFCVCKDGPVFTGEQISDMKDFGKSIRDECGCKKEL